MASRSSLPAQTKRIFREINDLKQDNEYDWGIEELVSIDHGSAKLMLHLPGPPDTPYQNAIFQVEVIFTAEHPFKAPQIRFNTPIFHPNVDVSSGHLSMDLMQKFSAGITLKYLLECILSLLTRPEDSVFLNQKAGFLWNRHPSKFRAKAIAFTEKYALPAIDNSTIPSEISSPSLSHCNSRACSPKSFLWEFQRFHLEIEDFRGIWQRYSMHDQLSLERAYRSDSPQVDLSTGVVSFVEGMCCDDDGNVYRVERNRSRNAIAPVSRRETESSSDTAETSVMNLAVHLARDSSISTDCKAIVNGIREEARIQNKTEKGERLIQSLEQIGCEDPVLLGLRCIHMYTKPSFLSETVNLFLRTWDISKRDTLAPFCKILYKQFQHHRTEINCLKVYRGTSLSAMDLSVYKNAIGKGRRQLLGFTSATKSIQVAKTFCRNCLFVIRLDKKHNGERILDISKLSYFAEEEEILIQPGVEFTVDRYKYKKTTGIYTFYLAVFV